MKEDLKYIDILTNEKLGKHEVEPKITWEETAKRLLESSSNSKINKPVSKYFVKNPLKVIIIFAFIIIGTISAILFTENNAPEKIKLIGPKNKIDMEFNEEMINEIKLSEENHKPKELYSNKPNKKIKSIVIKKEIVIKDTIFVKDTVTIEK